MPGLFWTFTWKLQLQTVAYSSYMFLFMRSCCSPCVGAISRLTVSQSRRHWNTHTHTRTIHTHHKSCSLFKSALGIREHLGTLGFLTFIITRKRATKWTKTKTEGGNQKKCFYQGPSVQGLTHSRTLRRTHTHTLPVPDPRVTPITFQHFKMQSRSLFSHWSLSHCVSAHAHTHVCVCVRIPHVIATITWQELYNCSLWSHFPQRAFWSFLSSFALFVSSVSHLF